MAARLDEGRMGIFRLVIRLDDFLWFASYEWGGDNETAPLLHNYALSFALSDHDRADTGGGVPNYENDLREINVYCTPARLIPVRLKQRQRTVLTFNSVDNPTQLTQALRIGEKVNDPKIGKRQVLLPGLHFELFAFTRRDASLPRVFRLGKKRSPVVVEEREQVRATVFEGTETTCHAVSPLDICGKVVQCVPRAIPPHLVYEWARIEGDTFLRTPRGAVHLPERVRNWASE